MAEVQKTTVSSGEMTFRFIEFVRMHTHSAGLFLGRTPHPQTGQPQVNLEFARMFIEQLAAIEAKTRGNLNGDEQAAITGSLTGLQEEFARLSERKTP